MFQMVGTFVKKDLSIYFEILLIAGDEENICVLKLSVRPTFYEIAAAVFSQAICPSGHLSISINLPTNMTNCYEFEHIQCTQ